MLLEWLCDVISQPRRYFPTLVSQGVAVRRDFSLVRNALRALEPAYIPSPELSVLAIQSKQLNLDSLQKFVTDFLEGRSRSPSNFDFPRLVSPASNLALDLYGAASCVGSHLISVADSLAKHLGATERGLPGPLYQCVFVFPIAMFPR